MLSVPGLPECRVRHTEAVASQKLMVLAAEIAIFQGR
jgi:hypothetical protein